MLLTPCSASESIEAIVGDPVQPPSTTKKLTQLATRQKRKGMCYMLRSRKTMLAEEVELYAVHPKKVYMHYVFKDISACKVTLTNMFCSGRLVGWSVFFTIFRNFWNI